MARPEGIPKVVIPTNRQNHPSFSLDKNRDIDEPQRLMARAKVRVTDQGHIPEGDVANLRMWQAAWKWKAVEAELHDACQRFPPKVAKQHEACDPSRSVQVELSYPGKLPNTPTVIS